MGFFTSRVLKLLERTDYNIDSKDHHQSADKLGKQLVKSILDQIDDVEEQADKKKRRS